MRHVGEALSEAKHAYGICLETKDSSSESISTFILRTKQVQWQSKETARLREMNDTLGAVEGMLEEKLAADLGQLDLQLEKGELGEIGRNEEVHCLRRRPKSGGAISGRPLQPPITQRVLSGWYQITSLTQSHLRSCTTQSSRPLEPHTIEWHSSNTCGLPVLIH